MNTLAALVLITTIIASFAYGGLGIAASMHFEGKDNIKSKPVAFNLFNFWWAFFEDGYDTRGKRLCLYGKVALIVSLGGWALWFIKFA